MSRYEMLAYFCLGGTVSMLLWSIHALIDVLRVRSEIKSESRRAEYRKYYQQVYWKRYLIHKHREELFEEWGDNVDIK